MSFRLSIFTSAIALALSNVSVAAPLYSQNFNVDDTANWTVNPSTGANATDVLADFFYDYSAIGVPPAPGGTGTRGLKLTANNTTGVFGGLTVSPTGQSFSGDYTLLFDMWQNYAGPVGPGGNGTTQFTQYGIGTAGTSTQWIGSASKDSVSFGTTLDGGSASDYRAYSSVANTSYPSGNAVYLAPAGAINNSAAYYMTAFPPVSAPAAQVASFPGQTGSTDAGETAFAWRKVRIDVSGGFATWWIDGTPLARVDLSTVTLGGGNILFGHSDTNAGASTDPNDVSLNVTLIDNIEVVPEPGTLAMCFLGAIGSLFVRRRS
jgi:PEP-CTERM motif